MRFGKPVDIRDDGSGRRFNPFNDFKDGAALRRRARNIRGFWLQLFVFTFVSKCGLVLSARVIMNFSSIWCRRKEAPVDLNIDQRKMAFRTVSNPD
jgi:hypothetical protein